MGMDWNAWNRGVIDEFRANGGKVGDQFEGKPMAVVTRATGTLIL